MKKILCLAILLIPITLVAETKNPDKFTSLGLSYSGVSADIEGKQADLFEQEGTATSGSIMLDIRIPIADSVTLSGGIGTYISEATMDENLFFDKATTEYSGIQYSVGVRYYFVK